MSTPSGGRAATLFQSAIVARVNAVLTRAKAPASPGASCPRRSQRRLALALAIPAVAIAAIAIARFVNGWADVDLAHLDQGLWLASHGHSPDSTIFQLGLLQDHFGPAILLFAPLYRIVSSPIWLLMAQVAAVWAAVWQISRRLIPSLGWRRAAAVGIALLVSPPVVFALFWDAHAVVFAVPFALAAVFAIREDRPSRGLVWGLLAAAFRADIAYGVLAAFVFLPGRTRRRLLPFAVLFTYVALATYLELYLGTEGGGHWAGYYGHLGASPLDALTHPGRIVSTLTTRSTVMKAVPWLATGGFLCLVRPRLAVAGLAVGLPTLLSRWPGTYFWGFHYGIAPALLLAVAWIPIVQRRPKLSWLVLCGVVVLNVIGGPFVREPVRDPATPWAGSFWEKNAGTDCIVKGIPPRAGVSTEVRPANFLAHRRLLLMWPYPFAGIPQFPTLRQARPDLAVKVDYIIRYRSAAPVPAGFVPDGDTMQYQRFRRQAFTVANDPHCEW